MIKGCDNHEQRWWSVNNRRWRVLHSPLESWAQVFESELKHCAAAPRVITYSQPQSSLTQPSSMQTIVVMVVRDDDDDNDDVDVDNVKLFGGELVVFYAANGDRYVQGDVVSVPCYLVLLRSS